MPEPQRIAGPGPCVRQLPGTSLVTEDDSGYAWPTWREALTDAFEGVDRAYERRRQIVQAAYDAGLSFRAIGAAVGMSASAIHKIIGRQRGSVGRQRGSDAILDAPATTAAASRREAPDA